MRHRLRAGLTLAAALLMGAALLTGCGGSSTDPNETRVAEFLNDALTRTTEAARLELCSDIDQSIESTVEALGGNPEFDELSAAQIRDVATAQFEAFCP